MKKMKKFVSLGLAAAMTFSLTACGGNASGTTAASDSSAAATSAAAAPAAATSQAAVSTGEKPKIVISTYLADDNQIAVRQKYIDEPLKAAFPNYDIEIKMYNDRQSLQVEVAGGGGPDILDLDGPTDVAEFARANRVLDLGKYADKYGWKDMFYDWAYNSCFYNKTLYSLPTSFEGMVMYYNMDVFKEHGWEQPKTLAELEALMPKIQEAGLIPISFGNSDYQGAVDWLYSTFTSCYAGPAAIKACMDGTGKYTDDKIKNSFQMMLDWWNKGWIGDKKSQSITTSDMVSFFASGKAAMMIDGTWASSLLVATYPDCNWDSQMMPADPEIGPILPFATGGGYAINANSKNPDAAAEIMNYLFTSEDRYYASINEASYQPYPLKNFDITKLTGMDKKLYNQLEVLLQAQKDNEIGYCSWTFYPADQRVYMNENVDSMFLGQLSLDDFLKESQTYIDAAIADGTVPVLP
jgi:raffinose/stachyose/melibiose transport system substrate-binding protein